MVKYKLQSTTFVYTSIGSAVGEIYVWTNCDVCTQTSSLANKFLFVSPVIGSDVVSLERHTAVFVVIVTVCHTNHTKLRNMLELQNANFYMFKCV